MIKIAFAGNPNVGKSALINAMAGSKLKVGNWPGVTVEKKEAFFRYKDQDIQLIDLPGVYSLSPYSMEEVITRDYILEENPDVIINVVDSTNLERNLYLTFLLKELGKPMIIALNLYDEFQKLEYKLDKKEFKQFLGLDMVPTSALKKDGVIKLLDRSIEIAKEKKDVKHIKYEIGFKKELEEDIKILKESLENDSRFSPVLKEFSVDYVAIKILESDEKFLKRLKNQFDIEKIEKAEILIKNIEKEYDEDIETVFAEARYGAIKGVLAKTLTTSMKTRLDFTDKVDKILLNRFFGPLTFMIIMMVVFSIIFNGSGPYIDWVDGFIADFVGKYVANIMVGTAPWLNSLVVDGILGGVGGVLVFVPLMVFLYFFMALLEESGYMSRVAFLMDKIMRGIGLNGKAFLPMILGFGCTVPAIYSTRTLDDLPSKRLTALMTPLMSCGARLPVYALFTAAFFGKQAGLVIFSLYGLGMLAAVILGFILKRFHYFKSEDRSLLIELPPYRIPTLKLILGSTFRRTWSYIKKAGTIILGILVILWGLMYFPNGGDVQNSYIGKFGKTFAVIFEPTGFGNRWETVAAIPPSLVAKEVVVGFMGQVLQNDTDNNEAEELAEETSFSEDLVGQISAFKDATVDSFKGMISMDVAGLFAAPSEEEVKEEGGEGVITALQNLWADDPLAKLRAYSYLLFILMVIPCVVALGAFFQEFGLKMFGIVLLTYTVVPYFVSVIFFQIGKLFY